MERKPEQLLESWMECVRGGKLEELLAMYADNAVLIPTFSNKLLKKPEQIREYFQRLCNRESLSISLHRKTLTVQSLGETLYSLCGIYCWQMVVDEELLSFEARFSYLFDMSLPHPILHHHSSQIPRML